MNLVASSTSSRMSVIRVSGIRWYEVGDEVAGPVRHDGGCGPFDAEHALVDAGARDRTGSRRGVQPPQTLVQRALALREPVLRTGRDRQAAVGINDSGSRQQRLPDVAVAARPCQPEVAGAERIAQVEQHRRLPQAVVGLGAQQPAPLRIRPQEAGRPRRGGVAQDVDGFQQGPGHGRRLDVQRAQHARRVAAEAAVARQHMVQRIRRDRGGKRGSRCDEVSETLPSGTVRDHRVERRARIPRADQRVPQSGEGP